MSQPSRPRVRNFFRSLRLRVSSTSNRPPSPQPAESFQGPPHPDPDPDPRPHSQAESSVPHPDPSQPVHDATALSPPLPNPYQLLLPSSTSPEHPAPSSRTEKMKEWGSTGWTALKAALKIVEKVSDALPPLKMAVSGLSAVIEHIDKIDDVKTDLFEMANKVNALAEIIERYRNAESALPAAVCGRLDGITKAIALQKAYIERKTKRGLLRRTLEAPDDVQDVVRALRSIASLVDLFTMDTALHTALHTAIGLEGIRQDVNKLVNHTTLDKLPHVAAATFKAQDREGCMEGTRVAILGNLLAWTMEADSPPIYWLSGMAGTGKSAIALALSRLLDANGLLGGSFFCSRQGSPELRDTRRIIPTLSHIMARVSPLFQSALLNALDRDPDAGNFSLSGQVATLLTEPFHSAFGEHPPILVLVIDALDECENDAAVETLLDIILKHAQSSRIKFFITSRPQPRIRSAFSDPDSHLHSILRLHDMEADIVHADIRLYLSTKLREIAVDRNGGWPPHAQLSALVELSDRLFIYAFTAYKYIKDPKGDAQERLNKLTRRHAGDMANLQMDKHIDGMYALILRDALTELDNDEASDTTRALGAIVSVCKPLSVYNIGCLLGMDAACARRALASLHSLVHVPHTDYDGCISTFHASFRDYLTDASRSGSDRWFVHSPDVHLELARACLQIMNAELHRNICQLEDSSVLNSEVSDLADRLLKYVPAQLLYSCQFWPAHVQHTPNQNPELQCLLETFVHEHIFHWLEVMSLTGETANAMLALRKVLGWMPPEDDGLSQLMKDLIQFTQTFGYVISQSALHIYLSAIPFIPMESLMFKACAHRIPDLPRVIGSLESWWDKGVLILNGHTSVVMSVDFSPDGRKIVSGSSDKTLRIWDTASGLSIMGPLTGHTDEVTSVAFSPDGKKIVSGSDDKSLRIWDTESGLSILGPLKGHTGWVTSVAFSPDGKKIVSGADDNTLHMWDTESGLSILGPLTGHTDEVASVAFSPDGKKIVSGSYDKSLHIWDTDSGLSILGPLMGHIGWVRSVAFSPDGRKIVSGSYDRTMHIWDTESGISILGPLRGHTGHVMSVAFSPDGKKIVSGSSDKTLCIWDTESGLNILGPLTGHLDRIMSIAFSPDGKKIVSADNTTLRIWDTESGLIPSPFTGHTGPVRSVACSPGGKIVSGSSDKTLRIWDTKSGMCILGPLTGHTGPVMSVACSPDGMKIVSGSSDETLHIWDTQSGLSILGPLTGHAGQVMSVAFSPDGKKIVSGSSDKTLCIWDTASGVFILGPFTGHTHWVLSVAFSPDGKRIVSGSSDKTLVIWDAESGVRIWGPLIGHADEVKSVAFSPDGTRIVSGSSDNTLHIWDTESGLSILGPLTEHTGPVTSVTFSPDGKKVVSSSLDGTLHIWDTESGRSILGPLTGHIGQVMSVAFSSDGTQIVSGSHDWTLRIWNTESGLSILSPLTGHTGPVMCIAFSPDWKRIVSGSWDNTLHMWDTESGLSILGPLTGHTGQVASVAFSPDGKKIVSGSHDKTLRMWDTQSGLNILGPLTGHTSVVMSVAFSPDGKKIVSGSYKTLYIWDTESGLCILSPLTHTGQVRSVAFSPDGKMIVSGSSDKTLVIWDTESGLCILGPLTGHAGVRSVAFSLDGKTIVSGSSDNTLHIWDIETGLHLLANTSQECLSPFTYAHVSPEGWLCDQLNSKLLWILPDQRGLSFVAASWGLYALWFNSRGLLNIVTRLHHLPWYSQA